MSSNQYHVWLERGEPSDLEPELRVLLPQMHAQAQRLLGNATDADDAVQEACMVLLETRLRLPPKVPLGAIANRLTGQRALMAARARQRRWRRFASLCSAL